MARVKIVSPDKAESRMHEMGIESRAYLGGEGDPLSLTMMSLVRGSRFVVAADGDCALFVWTGSVEAGGRTLAAQSSAIVEHGAALEVTGGPDGAELLLFAGTGADMASLAGGHVHLLPDAQVPRTTDLDGTGRMGGSLYANAACPTCRVWLHQNDFHIPGYEVGLHSHSEDEIIFVIGGSIRLGSRTYPPGTALAIAADTKYSFHTGAGGLSFVNFRTASPTVTSADGKIVHDEAQLWERFTGPPVYLEAVAG